VFETVKLQDQPVLPCLTACSVGRLYLSHRLWKPLLQLLIAGGVPKVGVNDVEAACCSQVADDAAIALE